jgi:hypothetical protein
VEERNPKALNRKSKIGCGIDKNNIFYIFVETLSLFILTIWKSIAYNLFCRDGIYFDKILVSEYKLFKRSNKANLLIAMVMKGGRGFVALKSDSTHHFFRNACTKSGSLRFSQFSGCWLILSILSTITQTLKSEEIHISLLRDLNFYIIMITIIEMQGILQHVF